MFVTPIVVVAVIVVGWLLFKKSNKPLSWPDAPLYEIPDFDPEWNQPQDVEAAKESIVGHYAHFDVVAYEDATTNTPMRTMIVSYGFTDFYLEDGNLYQRDEFVHAEQKINQRFIESGFRDEAVREIKPRVQQVDVSFVDGRWHVYRPATPTLLGIDGDPSLPLSQDPNDPNITDPDKDGKPGVTVDITIGKIIKGEIYIMRREIYSDHLILHSNGTLYGHVEDSSEQFVIGASLKILEQSSNAIQYGEIGLNPIQLIPISSDINTPEELMKHQHRLFPEEPEFR
jgi:hypothetical protein